MEPTEHRPDVDIEEEIERMQEIIDLETNNNDDDNQSENSDIDFLEGKHQFIICNLLYVQIIRL